MIRFRPMLTPTLWLLPAVALLLGLGVWQVQRLGWKTDLIQRVETRMRAAPEPLQQAIEGGLERAEWRHVTVRGFFHHEHEVYLFAQGPHHESGVQVITPFDTANGPTILVNRGFVPDAKRDPAARAAGQVTTETNVTGILRLGSQPGWFTPPPDMHRRLWFSRTVSSMAAAAGVPNALPLFVEADATPNPGGYPIGGQTVVDFPNNHLSYAITWFALALGLMGVYLVYHVKQGRLGWK